VRAAVGARARRARAEQPARLASARSEAGDTEDGYGGYSNNRKGCCTVQ
jgi:hypothetical protein